MFRHILIATDGSSVATKAAKSGIALASRLKAKVTAYSAVEAPVVVGLEGYAIDPGTMKELEEHARQVALKRLGAVAKMARAAGVPCAAVATRGVTVYEAIIAAAKKQKCDVIVLGSHGRRGIPKLLLGSVTQKVLAHSRLPVVIFR
jgi:nucleotide-binding universal stress UspA family protein